MMAYRSAMEPDDLDLVGRLERGLENLERWRREWAGTSQKAQRVINRIIVLRGQRRLLSVRMQYVARLREAGIASLEAELASLTQADPSS